MRIRFLVAILLAGITISTNFLRAAPNPAGNTVPLAIFPDEVNVPKTILAGEAFSISLSGVSSTCYSFNRSDIEINDKRKFIKIALWWERSLNSAICSNNIHGHPKLQPYTLDIDLIVKFAGKYRIIFEGVAFPSIEMLSISDGFVLPTEFEYFYNRMLNPVRLKDLMVSIKNTIVRQP